MCVCVCVRDSVECVGWCRMWDVCERVFKSDLVAAFELVYILYTSASASIIYVYIYVVDF